VWYIYVDTTLGMKYEVVLLLIVSLHLYISYIFNFMLHFLMFMNLTIHDSKYQFSDTLLVSRFNYHDRYILFDIDFSILDTQRHFLHTSE